MGNNSSASRDEESFGGTFSEDEPRIGTLTMTRRDSNDFPEQEDLDHSAETTGLYNVEGSSDEDQLKHHNRCVRVLKTLRRVIFSENWLFLIVLGITAALVGFGIDAAIYYLYEAQVKFSQLSTKYAGQYALWVLWSVVFSFLAILPIILISANASGT